MKNFCVDRFNLNIFGLCTRVSSFDLIIPVYARFFRMAEDGRGVPYALKDSLILCNVT